MNEYLIGKLNSRIFLIKETKATSISTAENCYSIHS